jgi:hypothetical protein
MKKQSSQIAALAILVVLWAVLWWKFIKVQPEAQAQAKQAAKANLADTPLHARFRKIRAEMDALYHYRAKPAAFDVAGNPFRVPVGVEMSADEEGSGTPGPAKSANVEAAQAAPIQELVTPDTAEAMLKAAVGALRIGGVVVRNGTTQFTIDGQLHREGDIFTAKVPANGKGPVRSIIVRIKRLTTDSVTIGMEEAGGHGAEIRVRLN